MRLPLFLRTRNSIALEAAALASRIDFLSQEILESRKLASDYQLAITPAISDYALETYEGLIVKRLAEVTADCAARNILLTRLHVLRARLAKKGA
jgi:hypothetical protein